MIFYARYIILYRQRNPNTLQILTKNIKHNVCVLFHWFYSHVTPAHNIISHISIQSPIELPREALYPILESRNEINLPQSEIVQVRVGIIFHFPNPQRKPPVWQCCRLKNLSFNTENFICTHIYLPYSITAGKTSVYAANYSKNRGHTTQCACLFHALKKSFHIQAILSATWHCAVLSVCFYRWQTKYNCQSRSVWPRECVHHKVQLQSKIFYGITRIVVSFKFNR